MTRSPDITCAECGRTMWRNARALPQGEATCRPCRRKWQSYIENQATKARRANLVDLECPVCHVVFRQDRSNQKYCSVICRDSRRGWAAQTATPAERGYGKEHRVARKHWARVVETGAASCCLCGGWISPHEPWHLDHRPDRSGYRGVAHAACNTRDGAVRARAKQLQTPRG